MVSIVAHPSAIATSSTPTTVPSATASASPLRDVVARLHALARR